MKSNAFAYYNDEYSGIKRNSYYTNDINPVRGFSEYRNELSEWGLLYKSKIDYVINKKSTSEVALLTYAEVVWRVFSIIGFGGFLIFILCIIFGMKALNLVVISFASLVLAYVARYIRKKVKNRADWLRMNN